MINSDLIIEELIDSGKYSDVNDKLDDNSVVLEVVDHIRNIKKDKTVVVVLIGGAASGKSTMIAKIVDLIEDSDVICTDDYVLGDRWYRRPLDKVDPIKKYDSELLNKKVKDICNLKEGGIVKVPTYEPISGLADAKGEENFDREIYKVKYLIVEGDFNLVKNPDYKIYFHVSDSVRLANRISRDTIKRNQTDIKELMDNFETRQKNQHKIYTLPASKTADMLILVSSS